MAAIHMLLGADKDRFGGAVEDFAHSYLMDKSNQYPADTQACYNLLSNWQKSSGRPRDRDRAGVSFNTLGDDDGTALVNDGGGKKYSGPPCEKCGWNNHATADCRAKKHKDGTMLHVEGTVNEAVEEDEVSDSCNAEDIHEIHELMFAQPDSSTSSTPQKSFFKGGIPDTWILLDSQSTIDVFSNKTLLSDIREIRTTMNIRCNAGVKVWLSW